MIRVNLAFFEPPIVFWSIWGLSLQKEMTLLPMFGFFLVVTGFLLGKIFVPLLKLEESSKKTFVISASLANHGFTLGGLLCFIFGGEKGLGLSTIFLLYFVPFTFLFIFFYAGSGGKNTWHPKAILEFLFNLRNMPLFAAFLALCVKWLNIRRPDVYFPIDILLIISVSLYYFTLGINFITGDLSFFRKEHFFLALQKFVILPGIVYGVLVLLNLPGDMKMVVMIQSFMPAAIYSVVTALLFNLDERLASSMFVVNSLLFIAFVLPVLFFFHTIVMF